MDLSVIVPLYNEEDNVALLYEAITNAVDPLGICYEMLFVDDGSADETFQRAAQLAANDPRLRVLKFRRNYGQTPAMAAGIDHASGDILITMDGDLQNDPADIPLFLDKMQQGYDIVVGWRHRRQDKLISRKIPSRIANHLIGKITGVPIKDNGCSLKSFRADVIKKIPLYSEMHRFIPAMSSLAGVRIAEIKVRHHARRFGESKYGLSRIYKVLLDLTVIKVFLAFLSRPLMAFALIAILATGVSLLSLINGLWVLVESPQYNGFIYFWLSLLYLVLATSLLFSGILAELVSRTGNLSPDTFARIKLEINRRNRQIKS